MRGEGRPFFAHGQPAYHKASRSVGYTFPGAKTGSGNSLLPSSRSLVTVLAPVLKAYLTRPYAFFGHSVGALVAFELARQLRRQYGLVPAHMFVSAFRAPQIPDPDPPMHQLHDAEFVEELARRYEGIPEAVQQDAELMEVFRPILRADIAMSETYRYLDEPLLGCPISSFGGVQDPSTTLEELDAWRVQTSGAFKLRMFPGAHFFINTARDDLLRAVAEDLECSLGRVSSKFLPVGLS